MTIEKNKDEIRIEAVFSFLIACYVNIPAINMIAIAWNPSFAGVFMTAAYVVAFSCLAMVVGISAALGKIKMSAGQLLYLMIPVAAYLMTLLFVKETSVSLPFFALKTVVPLFAATIMKIDAKVFVKSSLFLTVPGAFFIESIFVRSGYHEMISMGQSYTFLPTVMAAVCFLFFYWKECSLVAKLMYLGMLIVNAIYAFNIVLYGSRGPIMCIATCFLIFSVTKIGKNGIGVKIRGLRVVVLGTVAVVLIVNFWTILAGIQAFFLNFNVSFEFIDKMVRLNSEIGVLNGREEFYTAAINGFLDSPLIGHGLASFEHCTGLIYPHNFLLQFLFDGGILLFLALLFPVICGIFKWAKSCNKNEFCFLAMLLCAAVPSSLFSGEAWTDVTLWLAFGYAISFLRKKNSDTAVTVSELTREGVAE